MKNLISIFIVLALLIPVRAEPDFNLLTTDSYQTLLKKARQENKGVVIYKGEDKEQLNIAYNLAKQKDSLFYRAEKTDKRFENGIVELVNFMGVFHKEVFIVNTTVPQGDSKDEVVWETDYSVALSKVTTDKKLLIDFGTDPCVWCVRLEKNFENGKVKELLKKNYICLKINANSEQFKIFQSLQIQAYPTLFVINKERDILNRHTGYLEIPQLIEFLK